MRSLLRAVPAAACGGIRPSPARMRPTHAPPRTQSHTTHAVAKDYLSKSANVGRFSHTVDNHVFSFLAEDGYSELPQARIAY